MKPPFRAAATLFLLAVSAVRASAQGEDALVLPRGMVEANVQGTYSHYEGLFGSGDLGSRFATPFPASLFPSLTGNTTAIQQFFTVTQARAGGAPFTVGPADAALGTLRVGSGTDLRNAPITVRAGITRRLTVSATVPIEFRGTQVTSLRLTDATLGRNPNPTTNANNLAKIDPALAGVGQAALLPLATSPAGIEMLRRYRLLRAAGDSTLELVLPTRPISAGGLDTLLINDQLGRLPFSSIARPYELGDVEVAARFQLLNTVGPALRPSRSGPGGVRAAVELGVRLPTGRGGDLDSLTTVTSQSGQGGVTGALLGDLFSGSRWWVSGAARYTHPVARDVVRRTYDPAAIFLPLSDSTIVGRSPGDRIEVGVTPRYRLTDEISLAGRYAFLRQGATTLDLPSGFPAAGMALAGFETTDANTAQLFGLGVSYTTLTAYGEGRAKVPLDFSLLYERAVAGGSGAPKTSRITVGGRLFYQAWGRKRVPKPDTAAVARPDSVAPAPARPAGSPTVGEPAARPPAPRPTVPAPGTPPPTVPAPGTPPPGRED
jgi:hypothetical protein